MSRACRSAVLALAGAAMLALPVTSGRAADSAAPALPQPCAACHLPSGAGVPRAFPPLGENLRALAGTQPGRRYLVLAVVRGLAGPLTVDGKRFNGVMPAQQLKDEDIVRILNGRLAPGQRAFTLREVAGLRAGGASLGGAQVARLRPASAGR